MGKKGNNDEDWMEAEDGHPAQTRESQGLSRTTLGPEQIVLSRVLLLLLHLTRYK